MEIDWKDKVCKIYDQLLGTNLSRDMHEVFDSICTAMGQISLLLGIATCSEAQRDRIFMEMGLSANQKLQLLGLAKLAEKEFLKSSDNSSKYVK